MASWAHPALGMSELLQAKSCKVHAEETCVRLVAFVWVCEAMWPLRAYSEFANLTSFATSMGYAYLSKSISLNELIDTRRRECGPWLGPGWAGRCRLVSISLFKLIDLLE